MRGKYICIEGPDGAGKSTLANAIVTTLNTQGQESTYRNFPSDGPMGRLIRQGLRGELALDQKVYLYLFCADGLQQNQDIESMLQLGVHVICDRHPTMSGRVFQLDHHSFNQIETVYDSSTVDGVLPPDSLFVVDVPAEVTLARMRSREKYKDVVFESEDIEKVKDLRCRYLELARRYKATLLDGTWPTIDLVGQVTSSAIWGGDT